MAESKRIKLAALDLDGTLLNDNKTLCDGAADTLAEAAAHGMHIVPVTGRPLDGIPACIRELPFIDYYICSNGAQIIDAKTGAALYSFAIDNARSKEVVQVLRDLGCTFEPFANGVGYTEQAVYDDYMTRFGGTPLEEYITSSRRIIDNVDAVFADGRTEADEFFVQCADEALRDALVAAVETLGGLQYCLLGDRFMEITRQGTDKGETLRVLCRHLNVDIRRTVAFGDGDNDLTLLEAAGIGVAMGNAFPGVKEKAALVAKTNNENGVCDILKGLLNDED